MTAHNNGLCLALDIGGTNVRLGLVTRNGSIVARRRIPCIIGTGIEPFLASLRMEIDGLRREAGERGEVLLALGGGVPGLIDSRGVILSSVNLQPMENCNLRSSLEDVSALPVTLLNDANAAALAEASYGAGRPFASLLHFTLGTGVGSGLILNGKLWTGIDGVAAEYGHATVEPRGLPCPCGNRGCLEQYASATALARMAREGIRSGAKTSLSSGTGRLPDAEELARAARNGDRLALSCFAVAGRYLGIASATAVNLLNLEAIVIGGGVAQSFALLAPHVVEEIGRRAFRVTAERVQVLKGELGDDAGLLGAAAAAWQMVEKP